VTPTNASRRLIFFNSQKFCLSHVADHFNQLADHGGAAVLPPIIPTTQPSQIRIAGDDSG
jgi:hypothetical protein